MADDERRAEIEGKLTRYLAKRLNTPEHASAYLTSDVLDFLDRVRDPRNDEPTVYDCLAQSPQREGRDRDFRDEAVRNVDGRHGYTMEFASSPDAHREEYDREEERLRAEGEDHETSDAVRERPTRHLPVNGPDDRQPNAPDGGQLRDAATPASGRGRSSEQGEDHEAAT